MTTSDKSRTQTGPAVEREGAVKALHYVTWQPVEVVWSKGRITAIKPASAGSVDLPWIVPAILDIQVNGYGGIDFQRDGLTRDDLLVATRKLRRDGCPRIFLTLCTEEWKRLMARLRHVRALREQSMELMKSIAGWHLEGPFLCAQEGYRGAHRPDLMCDPQPEQIHELREVTGRDPVLLTIAPERKGALEAIRQAVASGMMVFAGHTNASRDELHAAMCNGLTGFTHFGNGCAQSLDRHDNILYRALDLEGLKLSMIPDRIHVPPSLFRLAHRVKGERNICYTTDAMSAGGMPPGRYPIADYEVEVGADQVVRQPGKTNFAGSAFRPIEGVFRAARMLHEPWQQAWHRASVLAAEFVSQRMELEVGSPADFCLLHVRNDQDVDHYSVCVDGELREATAWA